MRASRIAVFLIAITSLAGCGTIHNLKDPDPANGTMFIGGGVCYPMGGCTRSGLLALIGTPMGMVQVIQGNVDIARGEFATGFEQVGSGLMLTGTGLGAIVDTPLSLAGDIVTYPLAYGRYHRYPWATWWGEKSVNLEWRANWWLRDDERYTSPEATTKEANQHPPNAWKHGQTDERCQFPESPRIDGRMMLDRVSDSR